MNELSLIELETFRSLALQNSIELLAEAELLFQHKKFARTYTLAHLSSEELAKLPILAAHGVNLVNGQTISWKRLDEKLRSHETKLKGLLFVDLLGTGTPQRRKKREAAIGAKELRPPIGRLVGERRGNLYICLFFFRAYINGS